MAFCARRYYTDSEMLPFAAQMMVKLRCPHCGADEVKLRSAVKVGTSRKCPHCHRSYPFQRLLSVTTPKKRR